MATDSTMSPVSALLLEEHSLSIRPGAKGECPFCKHKTFSVKADDTLGKCFHPACGRFLTPWQGNSAYLVSLPRVLGAVYQDCHQELLGLATQQRNAYTYLREERGIHPQVIAEAMVGAVPWSYDLVPHFQPVIADAQDAVDKLQGAQRGRPTRQLQQAEKRLQDLKDAQQHLHNCLAHKAGWLVFFYTDAAHRCVALRLRQPYAKQFVSFKPGIAGVFGRELFSPYQSAAHESANDFLLIVEGEFNALQLQSLTIRYEEVTGQPLGYLNACAVGSVTTADTTTLQRATSRPVIVYDHDVNSAGFELVNRIQKTMPLEATTTPQVDSDLDSYICDFQQDHVAAWDAVKALIADRQPYGRIYAGTGEEFFDYPVTGGKKVFTPKLLGDALLARDTYRYSASQLWVYRAGVYLPCGETTLHADAQRLLGQERRELRIEEALRYVEVAAWHAEESMPDCQYINVLNGRLDWSTGTLEPHTPDYFTTVQIPLEYDPTATCPVFDAYLKTTFDADVHPLIEELLGWCLVPDTRFETSVMLTGEGKNGKGTFLDLVGYLLGDANVSNVALQDLEENRFRVAELYGKLANTFADLDTRALISSSMFKMLTSGDRLTAERKFGQPFAFRSYAKLLFSANQIPASHDRTYAFYRRWLIIPFTRTFNGEAGNDVPDLGLRGKLQGELPGIFNQALCGLKRLATNEAFTQPESVVEAKKAYIRSNEHVRAFVAECLKQDKNASIEKQAFYKVYDNWCDAYGDRALSQKALKDALKQLVPTLDEWRPGATEKRRWLGIDWSPDASAYF
jgi:P4 family phage/plasmid primase-like protien